MRKKNRSIGITVSDEGSWKREEFSSLYGIASLIVWHTGKVVDGFVKSEFCKNCELFGKIEKRLLNMKNGQNRI